METIAFNRAYLPLLLDALRIVEQEIEILETYINEDNINEFVDTYAYLQGHARNVRNEVRRVGKKIGISKKRMREMINP